ncbi:hypothetical protein APUTEX25_004830 [Auxenochlorella protothecoides]|uniref:DUF962 domain-containing protein n=1 Tax=Auxenochlorella protothecoides TaxID=3075 RepID=A0A3M7KVG5_AUXPR|nr:hypothetical protein APUTEX25_004830 [Auxenochlorella protothecoides]|eukprot:RMZ53342.1 hypothetical protein APUTEX25_004830 [Auxenochlorella protothecoides]
MVVANPNYKRLPLPASGFGTFADFYPFYLGEHANRTCRRLHILGTTIVLALDTLALLTLSLKVLPFVPLIGYGFAWTGHFFFEHNRPATFKHPMYSLMGDLRLWCEVVTRQRPL